MCVCMCTDVFVDVSLILYHCATHLLHHCVCRVCGIVAPRGAEPPHCQHEDERPLVALPRNLHTHLHTDKVHEWEWEWVRE